LNFSKFKKMVVNHFSEAEEDHLIEQLKDDSQGPGRIEKSNGNLGSMILDFVAGICKYLIYN